MRLDALRDMVKRGERIRRCQELPCSVFGDPERARFLVVVSHRWIDPRTCDVPTPEHPAGLRLETMVTKLEGFLFAVKLRQGIEFCRALEVCVV